MNYSKDSRAKTDKQSKTKNQRTKGKGKVATLRIFIISLIIGLFAVVGGGLGILIGIIKSTPDPSTLDIKPQGKYTSFVYDANGEEIGRFAPVDNREYATLNEIPTNLQNAFIALEDERFKQHNGIDIKGIFRAIAVNLKNGRFSEGASTITQQLIKNNILTSDKKITRKIQEQYLAIEFEKLYSKDTILEYYLNTIGLGQGVSGVKAAAERYFGKEPNDLTLTECAVIAAITQNPTRYNPIRNPERNWERAQICLKKMQELEFITEEEYLAALKENPYGNIQEVHREFQDNSTQSYFVDTVYKEVINDLQVRNGMTATAAKNLVYGGGLTIKTTVDTTMQTIAEKYINDESLYPDHLYRLQVDYSVFAKKADGTEINKSAQTILRSENELDAFISEKRSEWGINEDEIIQENVLKQPQPQAAFVLMDYRTGQVKAMAGGRGDKTNLGFNFVTQAKRQPGSTFKVLASYAPALDLGKLSPGSQISNDRYSITLYDGSTYTPNNWDNSYGGYYSVREAIANSMNVIAVKTMVDLVGVQTAFDYLESFGFTTLLDSDKVYSLPLGGITEGVTALELNAAYSAIANDGTYIKPVFYTEVLDSNNQVILSNIDETITQNSHTVIKASTAQMLTDMMTEVIDGPSKHTGSKIRQHFTYQNMPIAGKTGTTTDEKDLVFSGYTPYYSATIWTGYSQPSPLNKSGSYHLMIWSKIMSEIHETLELPYKSFPTVAIDNSGVSEYTICNVSGKLATALCREDHEHGVISDYFTSSTAPTEYCDVHVEVEICTESGKVANEYCPEELKEKRSIVRNTLNGSAVQDKICDIHGPEENVETENPEDIPGADQIPNVPDLTPPSDSTTPPGEVVPTPPTDSSSEDVPSDTPSDGAPLETPVPPSEDSNNENDFFVPQS